jgi:hypothetical protein
VHGSALTTGNTTSCGCRRRETLTKHGQSRTTRAYRAWRGAKSRCYNESHISYPNYDFAAFFAHLGPCPDGYSLDRFPDNDGHYEPGNVRWATPREQSNNRRVNRRVDFGGVLITVAEIARAMEIDWKTAKRKYGHA